MENLVKIPLKDHLNSYHLSYRGLEFDAIYDISTEQYYVTWNGEKFYIENFSNNEFTDLRLLIDDQLDTITRFEDLPTVSGAKLEWFRNGDFRDIRLVQRRRILKIYLVVDKATVNLEAIKSDAINILLNINKLIN